MRTLGWIVLVVGLAAFLAGGFVAMRPVVTAYQQALTDPLSDKMPDGGKGVASSMIPGIVLAGVGVAGCVAGRIVLMVAKRGGARR